MVKSHGYFFEDWKNAIVETFNIFKKMFEQWGYTR